MVVVVATSAFASTLAGDQMFVRGAVELPGEPTVKGWNERGVVPTCTASVVRANPFPALVVPDVTNA